MNFDKETAMLTHRLLARTRALGAVLELKGERVAWDDRTVAREEIANRP